MERVAPDPLGSRPDADARARRLTGRPSPHVWWGALTSGRFLTWWSAAISFVMSVTVLGAFLGVDEPDEYPTALAVSVLSWVVLFSALLPVAWGERRLSEPRARGALVLVAVLAASATRPFLNDGLGALLGSAAVSGSWASRVATNVIVWMLLLSLVGIATSAHAASEVASRRLRAALKALSQVERRAERYDRSSREAVTDVVAQLRRALGELSPAGTGFDEVRAFSDSVRAASHDLEDRADDELGDMPAGLPAATSSPRSRVPLLGRLRPPPVLLVLALYLLGSLPFALHAMPPRAVTVCVALVLGLSLLADLAPRRVGRGAEARGLVLVAGWIAGGAVMSGATLALAPESGWVALTPLLILPSIAVASALATDAIHRSGVQADRLTEALAAEAEGLTMRTAQTRRMLRAAADRLHSRVQGRCVVFAATLDERPATPAELEGFQATVTGELAGLRHPAPHEGDPARELCDLLATWGHVLTLSSRIDESARAMLRSGEVSGRVVGIVGEGLLNAVKHSGARRAEVTLSRIDPAAGLLVQVAAPGALTPRTGRRDGRGLARIDGARLSQRGRDVVLEAVVPLTPPARAADLETTAGVA